MKNYIGEQVRRFRNERGWSQNKLAIKLQFAGMPNATRGKISKIESCLVKTTEVEIMFIARALGVEFQDLFPPACRFNKNIYEGLESTRRRKMPPSKLPNSKPPKKKMPQK
jgi:transcriptional regulator with XRE-family HTH domain